MSVVTSTWHQLVHRRLWPVAVVLLVALVAIPVVLARDPEAAEVPAPAPVGGPTSTTRSLRRSWRRPRPRMATAAAECSASARTRSSRPPVKTPEPTTQQATAPNTGGSH